MKKESTHWEESENWYSRCVGEKGHYYHQQIVLPNAVRLLDLKKSDSLLDLGCGQGVLLRHLPKSIEYVGIDGSKALIHEAKKLSPPTAQFIVADVTESLPIQKNDFDAACFILSLQNMQEPEKAISHAAHHLKKGGKLLLVLNHPCFRIPRQSSWGIDEPAKMQYRRMNVYMTPQKIPIQTHPGQGAKSPNTFSFHHPLSQYVHWLSQHGLLVSALEEWCSDKKSEGARAKMEDRARKEFPLFLALLARKS
jgi:SAM-dependent methyltransferase